MDLNDEQARALQIQNRVMIIKAGPGTGKTKTLVSRINYLLDNGITPEQIVAITFTKKAAAEMKERLKQNANHKLPTITTFHGFAFDLLQQTSDRPIITIQRM